MDVYLVFEHKSYPDKRIFIQLLHYMYRMWHSDVQEKKSLRVILPVVFYPGKGRWKIPTRFVEQFTVASQLKAYLLDFPYILFDTNRWDWQEEKNRPLRDNIFLLSAIVLMKASARQNIELIRKMFQLWNKMGFVGEKEIIKFLMVYVSETQEINYSKLNKILEESQIPGEEIMPTLAQRLREEGKKSTERRNATGFTFRKTAYSYHAFILPFSVNQRRESIHSSRKSAG